MSVQKKVMLLACLLGGAASMGQTAELQRFDAKSKDLVSQMTLDEKLAQLWGTSNKHTNRIVLGLDRLHIPALTITNGPAGAGPAGPGHDGSATAFPAPISLAATWDVNAADLQGNISAIEARHLGNLLLESPDINMARTPQNGRTFESFGEDPYLAGQLAVANIKAIQSQHVIANVKHFAANNQETDRFKIDEEIDERTLREIYLPAFEAAVVDGDVGSIMGAYNKINGTFCCENEMLLTKILKGDWKFAGFVTSDFGAVHSTLECATHGLDVELPNGKFWGKLKPLVESGQVPMAVIDNKLARRFRTMMRLGAWEAPVITPIDEAAGAAAARKLAIEGTVLLKNRSGELPLQPAGIKTIALIGPKAANASTGGGGSSHVKPLHVVTPTQGLINKLGSSVTIKVDDGKDIDSAAALAKASDLTLLMLGDQATEGKDHELLLDKNQNELTSAVLAANPKTIVVIKSGSPVLMPWIASASAILEMWYPGQEEGDALAAIIFGDAEPSGRLPITFPKSQEDQPAHTVAQYPGIDGIAHYSEGLLIGYRWYDDQKIEPLFPFGFGLSYTQFEYRNLKVMPGLVEFDVSNIGSRAGVTVAQLYLDLPSSKSVPQPPRKLAGFTRLEIAATKSAHASINIDTRSLRYWDIATHGWKPITGSVNVELGTSSRDIKLNGTLNAGGD